MRNTLNTEMLEAMLSRLGQIAGPDTQGWYTALCPYYNDRNHLIKGDSDEQGKYSDNR